LVVRIRGGVGGIGEYLETGRMRGREATREALDERVILTGSLDVLNAAIDLKSGKGERYLHITLSFKEDEVSKETLNEVIHSFEHFAFAAYKPEEYCLYAEAHLPRIKSYADKGTDGTVVRKPHIHVVIPTINLLTGGNLNPFGRVTFNIGFIDAWQEETNRALGLASPKDNLRTVITGRSEVVSRYKGDLFGGANRDLKQTILKDILDQDIRSLDALAAHLEGIGTGRLRNHGTSRAYLNVKLDGEEKGVNLKESIFTADFLALSVEKKRELIIQPQDGGYIEAGTSRPSADTDAERVREWLSVRAREVKYLNSGRKAEYQRYKQLGPVGRENILAKREQAFYEGIGRRGLAPMMGNVLREDQTLAIAERGLVPRVATDMDAQRIAEGEAVLPVSVAAQLTRDRFEDRAIVAEGSKALIAEAKRSIDVDGLLDELAKIQGLERSKYPVGVGMDGLPRITCGSRHLTVADFLTKEVHLPWHKSADLLCTVYARQVRESEAVSEGMKARWAVYEHEVEATAAQRNHERETAREATRKRFAEARATYLAKKKNILADTSLEIAPRRTRLSLLRAEHLAAEEAIRLETKQESTARAIRERQSIAGSCPVAELTNGNAAGHAPTHTTPIPSSTPVIAPRGFSGPGAQSPLPPVPLFADLLQRILEDGSVEYSKGPRRLFCDAPRVVWVYDESPEAIEAGLRMALLKFGPYLHIFGPDSFKQSVLETAVRLRLDVRFDEPALQNALETARGGKLDHGTHSQNNETPGLPKDPIATTLDQAVSMQSRQNNRTEKGHDSFSW